MLLGKIKYNGDLITASYIDEAPYNTRGNAAMRLIGSTKNGKRRLKPIDNETYQVIENTREVFENYIGLQKQISIRLRD